MTQPRPSFTLLAQQVAALQAQVTRLEEDNARLRAGVESVPKTDFERAQSRISQLEASLRDLQSERIQSDTPPDLAPLEARIAVLEEAGARDEAEVPVPPVLTAALERLSVVERRLSEPPPTPEPPPPRVDLAPLEARIQQVEELAARNEALPPADTRVDAALERLAAVEARMKDTPDDSDFRTQVFAALREVREAAEGAKQQAMVAANETYRIGDGFARDIAELKGQIATAAPGPSPEMTAQVAALKGQLDLLTSYFLQDPILYTATTRKGLQVPTSGLLDSAVTTDKITALAVTDAKINDLASTKLTGGVKGAANNNALLAAATDVASGQGVVAVKDATSAPAGTPSGGGVLYSDAGALKWKGSGGTVTTVAPA